MIKAIFSLNQKTKYIKLTVKGHAGYGKIGEDIICSAATILADTVAQIVLDLDRRGLLREKPLIKRESGNMIIACKPVDYAFDEAIHTYLVAQTGFKLLNHNFKNYVDVKLFGY